MNRLSKAVELLDRLVSFPTISGSDNREVLDFVGEYLKSYGVTHRRVEGVGPQRENFFATIGDNNEHGIILSGHLDVVPADKDRWGADPFRLRRLDDRLLGRGAVDMKGFIAAVLASVPTWADDTEAMPIHLAFSYDEELGCLGVNTLIESLTQLCAPPVACLVGEPTGLVPVLAHKGKVAYRVIVRGRSGHSARPDQGVNAIHPAAKLMMAIDEIACSLQAACLGSDGFDPPNSTLQVGRVEGGTSVNVIAEECAFSFELRFLPDHDEARVLSPFFALIDQLRVENVGLQITIENLSRYPALNQDQPSWLVNAVADASGRSPSGGVSFGTEAGIFQAAGIPSLVCGPGDMARAHKEDEFIKIDEISDCLKMLDILIPRFTSSDQATYLNK